MPTLTATVPTTLNGIAVPTDQWLLATEYMSTVNGADTVNVSWKSVKSVKQIRAAFRAKEIVSHTTATVERGIKYADHSDNEGRTTGELLYGEWLVENHLILHNGQILVRLYTVDGSLESTYTANGETITRDEYREMIYKSSGRGNAGTVNIKIQNLTVHPA